MPDYESIRFFDINKSPEPPKQKSEKEIKARQDISRLEKPDTIKIPEHSTNTFGIEEDKLKLLKEKYPEEWLNIISKYTDSDEDIKNFMIEQLLEKD